MTRKRGMSPMDYALGYLTGRDRTEYEMRAYLDQQEFGEADVDLCIDRLKELNLINDRTFAEHFVKTRLASKPISRAHLTRQLREHHVSDEYIRAALEETDSKTEEANARAIAEKYFRQFASLEPEKRKQRVINRLLARGFGSDLSFRMYREAEAAFEEEQE